MIKPSVVVLIPESTRKRRGGEPDLPPVDGIVEALPQPARERLETLREELLEATGRKGVEDERVLPAYRRFDGNMYRRIELEAWEARAPGVEVLIVSGLRGLLASRDTIPRYGHSMAEPMPPLGKLNRWWHERGLARILGDYLGTIRPNAVVDLLSLEYREAVEGFADGLRGVAVKAIDFPGMGRGSQPMRGEAITKILRAGKADSGAGL